VSIAKSGFHDSGGMILQMPNFCASGLILLMYSNGSFHSSSVGQYVGASSNPNGRFFFVTGSGCAVDRPRRSTDMRSSGGLFIALKVIGGLGGWPFGSAEPAFGLPFPF
jgi:hypothetical protein